MNDQSFLRPNQVVITSSDIQRWVEHYTQLNADLKTLQNELKDAEAKIRAAELLLGRALISEKGGEKSIPEPSHQTSESMIDAIVRIVKESDRALSHQQITKRLRENPDFRERMENNQNYYYTAVSRLLKRGEIAKVGKNYCAP